MTHVRGVVLLFGLSWSLLAASGAAADEGETALLRQGVLLASQGRTEAAAEIFLQAIDKDPENAKAWNNLGLVLRKQKKTAQALEAYRQAIVSDPSLAVAYKNFGALLEELGEKQAAAKAYDRYCASQPSAADAGALQRRARWLERKSN